MFKIVHQIRHDEAIRLGSTHISTCFMERLNRGDHSELTERRARLEVATLNNRLEVTKRKLALLNDIQARRELGEPVSSDELHFAGSGTGTASCLPGDEDSDADFLADNF